MERLNDRIRALLGTKKALDRRRLAERLALRGAERKSLTRVLKQMVREGEIEEGRAGYRLASPQAMVEGVFVRTDKGYGFVNPGAGVEDIFIPARYVGSAMDGDRVRVRLRRSQRDQRSYGEIITIVSRARSRMIGTVRWRAGGAVVVPQDARHGPPVQVALKADIADGEIVEIVIEHYAKDGVPASGRIVERLGRGDDPRVDIVAVIRNQNLPDKFSPEALAAAAAIASAVSPAECADRTDLRALPLVTIDSETARDFDDAVALRKLEDGTFRLWVCIADVAHYVTPGSAIDKDAQERSTSVYFPGFVVPMLPEALSNGICSLNPGVDRLVMTAELHIGLQGEPLAAQFYPAVINSHARLTYTRVAACLDADERTDLAPELVSQLQQMAELARILNRMRTERGSLNLDIDEVEILVDEQGRPVELVKVERTIAHRLVEEFMLAANEAVARFLGGGGWPLLYRVHEVPDPDKLEELQQLAASCGHGLLLGSRLHKSMQALLNSVAGRPEGRLINQQLLRSLQQAIYTPHNLGHFGLAAEDYCHFTSPIRRYPDLVVHRVLKLAVSGQPKSRAAGIEELEILGSECSAKERRAMEAERDLLDLRRCQLMLERLGEEFDGIISAVVEFGFFVELDDLLVEGLVHMRTMQEDFYHFDPTLLTLTGERLRRQYHVGMPVRVKLDRVDLPRRRIDFVLAEAPVRSGRKRSSGRAQKS